MSRTEGRREAGARRKPRVRAALPRFAAVGLVGMGVNEACLFVLHGVVGLPLVPASAAATELAILHNYIGNELWTFHHRRLDLGRLLRFNAVALGGLALTVASLWALQRVTPFHYLVDNVAAVAVGALWNFGMNFGWTWRS